MTAIHEESRTKPWIGWVMVGLVSLFYGYQFFIRVSPSVMGEELMRTFHITASSLGVLSSSYYLVYAPLQLPVGILMDRLGPRRIVSVAVLLCGLGCLFFSLAQDLAMAKIGRMLMGAGSACAFLGCMKVATMWLPPHRFTTALGFTMMVGTLGAVTASEPLARCIQAFGWRGTLEALTGVGIFLALLIFLLVKDKKQALMHLDQEAPLTSVVQALFSIMRNPQCWLAGFYTGLMYAPLVVFGDIWGVPYLRHRFSLSSIEAAGPAAMLYLGLAFGAPFFAWLSDRLQKRKTPMFITSVSVLCLFSLLLYGPVLPLSVVTGVIFVVGFSLGGQFLGFPVICELNARSLSGTASGFNNSICMLLGVFFQPCVGYVLDMCWTGTCDQTGVRLYDIGSYTKGLTLIPSCAMMSIGILAALRETYPKVGGLAPKIAKG